MLIGSGLKVHNLPALSIRSWNKNTLNPPFFVNDNKKCVFLSFSMLTH